MILFLYGFVFGGFVVKDSFFHYFGYFIFATSD